MRISTRISATLGIGALVLISSCGHKLTSQLGLPNQPPVVSITSSPPDIADNSVVHRLSWTASDPDGRVDHYLVAQNPRSIDNVDGTWHAVTETQRALTLRRAVPVAAGLAAVPARELAVFAVRAVDDQGAVSAPAVRAMWSENIAPIATIDLPAPSGLLTAFVPPTVRIHWHGTDPDGRDASHVAKFKFKLFDEHDPDYPLSYGPGFQDSLLHRYAPGFAGWDSVPGDSLGHAFTGLAEGDKYLLALTAIDERGDYDPVFSFDKNLLNMYVNVLGLAKLTLYNDYFSWTNPSAQIDVSPTTEGHVEAPVSQPFTVQWNAAVPYGDQVTGYRWAVDIADIHDETPRQHPGDIHHWSRWSPTIQSATVDLFREQDSEPHQFYVQVADELGYVNIAAVLVQPFLATLNRDILIVDDTRRQVDVRPFGQPDAILPPSGEWPTAAELDTFLFARGGVPWRHYPEGTLSTPGIFDGYSFDTLGTRSADGTPPTVSVATLGRYRHVIWIVDAASARMTSLATAKQISALRFFSMRNRQSPLATYIASGGKVWLLGGGIGYASSINTNHSGDPTTYSPELVAGNLMYDAPHWRSGFRATDASQTEDLTLASGGSSLPGLPSSLQRRSPPGDAVPPLRSPSIFFGAAFALEYLNAPNSILEPGWGEGHGDAGDDEHEHGEHQHGVHVSGEHERGEHEDRDGDHGEHEHHHMMSVLDTLYFTSAGAPCMTRYRGHDNAGVIFSGFDLWSFERSQEVQLVNAVLGGVWGLTRSAPPPAAAMAQRDDPKIKRVPRH